jgi:hypothetical protein
MPQLTARQQHLLAALRTRRGVVTTRRVHEVNRDLGAPKRTTARRDIAALHRAGLLIQGGADHARFYLLTRKAARLAARAVELEAELIVATAINQRLKEGQ